MLVKGSLGSRMAVIVEALKKNSWRLEDVDLFIPHQANARIAQQVAQTMGIPLEKIFLNIHKYGNTTAASIPIALAEATREGRANKGDKLMLFSFGSGLTWASSAIVL